MSPLCIELFAGCGAAALGLHAAGWHHALLVERDPDAARTLLENRVGPVLQSDVAAVDLTPWQGLVGLLWASPPCQPYSTAGKGLGADDPRDGWPLTVAAIRQALPTWFVAENVRGCPAARWCAELQDLGYAVAEHRLLNAADYGVPQHRRRVFVVAGPRRITWPRTTHADPALLGGALFRDPRRPWVSAREALGLSVFCHATHPEGAVSDADRRVRTIDGPSMCLGTYTGGVNRGGQPWVMAPGNGGNKPALRSIEEPAHTLSTRTPMYLQPAPTVATTTSSGVSSAKSRAALERTTGKRKLSPAECKVLQSIPAGHRITGNKTAQYRQIGNAVPPILAQVLGQAVRQAASAQRGVA